jgi:hypothetical protein
MNNKLIDAILAINPDAQCTYTDEDVDSVQWYNDTAPISKEDILAKMTELQAEYDNNQYQRDRAAEYPSIADQLDDIYHNGIDGWKTTIKETKDKYPKS